MNKVNLNYNAKISHEIEVNQHSLKVINGYVTEYKKINPSTKSTDNDIAFRFINDLLNLVKTSDITLNNLELSLIDNKITGKNKQDFKEKKAADYINQILSTGKVTINNKNIFVKDILYYNTDKKCFVRFKDINTFKAYDNNFKNYSQNTIIYKKFKIDLSTGVTVKVNLNDINK